METNKIDSFNENAEILFRHLLEKYGYVLIEKKIKEVNGQKWLAHHVYLNYKLKLKIEIKQEPYYTDYGFAFWIYQLETGKYNILYNVPHEKQDNQDKFLEKACNDLFKDPMIVDLISGNSWRDLKYIPYQP